MNGRTGEGRDEYEKKIRYLPNPKRSMFSRREEKNRMKHEERREEWDIDWKRRKRMRKERKSVVWERREQTRENRKKNR